MQMEQKVRTLQAVYAGALADAVLRLGSEGVLEKVTQQKRMEQLAGGKMRAAQLGIQNSAEVFTKLSELMGCADWNVVPLKNGFTAAASQCMLCAFAKKTGTFSPCRIYCLDPMEGMVKGLYENAAFDVQSTLFEGSQCRVAVTYSR